MNVILIVEPHALPDPTPVPDMQLPREAHPRAGPEHHAVADLGAKQPEDTHTQTGTDLQRIRNEEQLGQTPEVHDPSSPIPTHAFTGGRRK
ncbi:MAG: hypothetical protein VB093_12415, partial [Propionicimonas sp.]|nr:hypothetical protein [Propionicimonas sp.]